MKRTAIIFDTETTGLPMPNSAPIEKQPRIIELGAVKIDHTGEIGFINELIDPEMALPPEITKITGINQEDLVGKPKFSELIPRLVEFFSGAHLLVAHNCPFDRKMVQFELQRSGCEDFPWPEESICTVQEYRNLFGHRPKLTDLYQRIMDKPLDQTHRAIDDVRALYDVLVKDNFFDKIEG